MSDFQISMIAAGVFAVLGVVAYNAMQERRARRRAEQMFQPAARDALLDAEPVTPIAPPAGGRMEPGLPGNADLLEEFDTTDAAPNVSAAGQKTAKPVHAPLPALPVDTRLIDCAVLIEAPAGLAASALINAEHTLLAGFSKPIRWYGWQDSDNQWHALAARSPGDYTQVIVALQLADRQGAVQEAELGRFYEQVQKLCDQFLAVPRLPARAEVLATAAAIDAFCNDFDIQIAFNLVANSSSFAGTKIRGLAEAAGMVLRADGCYHAEDEHGLSLFVLSNQENAVFSPEQLRNLHTPALSLTLDVPRNPEPVANFVRMLQFAQQLAAALDGTLVDDNRRPLSERALGLIRDQVSQFAHDMAQQGLPAGSSTCLRLFQ